MIARKTFAIFFAFSLSILSAQESATNQAAPTKEERLCTVKNQSVLINGKSIVYDVIGGTLPVTNSSGKSEASMFYTAYFAKADAVGCRPIAFCFNGGPGAASIWLHMGGLGPKKIDTKGLLPNSSPIDCKDNPFSLLAVTDLVFIDPISTGFSMAVEKAKENDFFSIDDDLYSFACFVRLFLSKFERWQSPKLLIGESYGTLRAVRLAHLLRDHFSIGIDGLALISLVLDLQDPVQEPWGDLVDVSFLPSYAAIAHYHKGGEQSESVAQLVDKVSTFALEEYLPALAQGTNLSHEKEVHISKKLSEFTLLPESFFLPLSLRLSQERFSEELLKERGVLVGRYDGRICRPQTFDELGMGLIFPPDPSEAVYSSTFASAVQKYFLCDLLWKKEGGYVLFSNEANRSWNWTQPSMHLSSSQLLRTEMSSNPQLKVFVAAGYYDLATPYLSQEMALSHLFLHEELRKNITFKGYEAGHMIYLSPASQRPFFEDMCQFISSLTSGYSPVPASSSGESAQSG